MALTGLKGRAAAAVESRRQALIDLSLRIHQSPELGFQEEKAAAWLAAYLEGEGFVVERGICGLPTAFRASFGEGRPVVGLLAEYDALPGLGHACGHNIIGTAAVAAGIAAREALAPGQGQGTIVVIGTPAEEVYGGKVLMAEGGAFAGLDCAMLAHPGSREAAVTHSLACADLEVEYFGRAAHAAAHFLVRAEEDEYLEELKGRVLGCFQGGAQATGARLEHRWGQVQYAALRCNRALAEAYRRNMEALGRSFPERPQGQRGFGSTDMGNVSRLVPAIHPTVSISPPEISIHTPEFAVLAAGEEGHRGLLDAAKALALTAADVLTDPELRRRVREEFEGASPGGPGG